MQRGRPGWDNSTDPFGEITNPHVIAARRELDRLRQLETGSAGGSAEQTGDGRSKQWVVSAEQLRHPLSRKGSSLLQKAKKYAQSQQHDKSIETLREALKEPSAAPYAHGLLGVEYLRATQIPEALEELQKAVELMPHAPGNHSNYGFALCLSGDYQRGRKEIEAALKLDRDLPQARFLLGLLQLDQKSQQREAEENLRAAAESKLGSAHLILAVYYLRRGDEGAAHQHLLDYLGPQRAGEIEKVRAWAAESANTTEFAPLGFFLGAGK
jgi:Tfp pilus assembly protein PilF